MSLPPGIDTKKSWGLPLLNCMDSTMEPFVPPIKAVTLTNCLNTASTLSLLVAS